ncbi:hypothetical protein TrRE_jg8594 [Triparma retinervis]|uniref:Fe2OG dioxygenase domain-containing protein n=1 Tax=Triparma retinervis TaxID=2557542 RepID=A0A9W7AKV8_9STRA|nr:hypothetical protein TrRE_jg8594 [Triparma retinervis]
MTIPADADSGTVSGVHNFGGMSKYNTCRAGVVLSDGDILPNLQGWDGKSQSKFRSKGAAIVRLVYKEIEEDLGIKEGWFEETYGDAEETAQWHVKVFNSGSISTTDEGVNVRLPVHTDPSLISVVLHDTPTREGGMGLEYLLTGKREWRSVSSCGHGRATVIVGSVMEKITGGRYKAARHRVVEEEGRVGEDRVAATFFFRPGGKKVLTVPPSAKLEGVKVVEIPFGTWLRKTSKKYAKHKQLVRDRTLDKKEKVQLREEGKGENIDGTFVSRKQRKAKEMMEILEREKMEMDLPKPPVVKKPIIDPPVYNHCGSACQLIGDEIIGQEKYLGGECGSDGRIYAIPGCAPQVLRIDPKTGITDLVGPVMKGEFKWLRSVKAIDGDGNEAIYGLPCHASSVLKIVPATGEVKTFGELGEQEWKYHGGNLAMGKTGLRIWCIPQKATRVMTIDPMNDTVELIGPEFPGICKWYGGLPGRVDGCVYGMPQNAGGVLKINPKREEITIMGKLKEGGHKWHGGLCDEEGNIWAIPANADGILKVDVENQEIKIIGDGKFVTGSHRDDGKYKFLGGVMGVDGKLYMIPCDADYVVQVDPKTEVIRNIGPNLKDNAYVQTKWQNGFSAEDGSIYCVPLKGEKVLCIRPHKLMADGTPEVDLIGGPYMAINKWEGGVVGPDGACYCMPLGHRRVLRISPPGGNVLKPNNGLIKADVAEQL